ncbi:metallophosphoesterase family protein [Carboxydothermus ferrireducens]|uniref:DNA repair exonuclease SbcCD nuclease subunit n=1 Tax=Carboxydothermus ferrireducens DSM 11255 TaxID=1119529 RepID=A0ABX2R725_9THEO|nr:metallophosphoesterase [Carboxydothermus ferrireducens]NYE56850.1 DNA repair exonuclease SbcCD nuclease subunit [Carboxydothermus ferrireducens DSM 11255]
MRFLYITDTHFRGNSPQNRMDDFPQTLRKKMEEVVQAAQDLQVEAVLHGGDLFEIPNPAVNVVGDVVRFLKALGKPFYIVPGNHDLFGQNPQTLNRTMLGLLGQVGLLKILEPGEKVFFKKDGVRLQLTGQGYHFDLDTERGREGYLVKNKEADLAIHIVHGMLLDRPFFQTVAYTLIDDIKETEADLTLTGHAHLGFNEIVVNNKKFINPGALVRTTVLPAEVNRWPQMVLIEAGKDGITTKFLPLKTALPGEQVLNIEKATEMKLREERLARIISEVRTGGDFRSLKLENILREIAQKEQLPEEVREEALKRIAQAEIEMAREEVDDDVP